MSSLLDLIAITTNMKGQNIHVGDSLYLLRKKVIVCEVLFPFQLAIVRYEHENRRFTVDQSALSDIPSQTYSVPITLFKGVTI